MTTQSHEYITIVVKLLMDLQNSSGKKSQYAWPINPTNETCIVATQKVITINGACVKCDSGWWRELQGNRIESIEVAPRMGLLRSPILRFQNNQRTPQRRLS